MLPSWRSGAWPIMPRSRTPASTSRAVASACRVNSLRAESSTERLIEHRGGHAADGEGHHGDRHQRPEEAPAHAQPAIR